MQQKLRQSSVILRVFAVILTCAFFAMAAMGQEKGANVAPASQAGTVATGGNSVDVNTDLSATDSTPRKTTASSSATASTPITKSNDSTAAGTSNGSTDYKQTLNNLEALY